MKRTLITLLFALVVFGSGVLSVQAATAQDYKPLTGINGITQIGNNSTIPPIGTFLVNIFNLTVGIAGILAVIMIMWGGIEYMMSDALDTKNSGKEKMTQSVYGLLFVLLSVAILYTINPQLLNLSFLVPPLDTIKSVNSAGTTPNTATRYPIAGDQASKDACIKNGGTPIPPAPQADTWSCENTTSQVAAVTSGIGVTDFCPQDQVEIDGFTQGCLADGGTVRGSPASIYQSCFANKQLKCFSIKNIQLPTSILQNSNVCANKVSIAANNMYLIEQTDTYRNLKQKCDAHGAQLLYPGIDCDKYAEDQFCQPDGRTPVKVCASAEIQCPEAI